MSTLVPLEDQEWGEELEGQLAIDVYQTPADIIIKVPIAGVRQEDLEVSITNDHVTIKGERHDRTADSVESYLVQECYWGSFSRTYPFPVSVDSDRAHAKLVDGILTVTVPKTEEAKTRTLSVAVE